jgi:hypothetical protein
MVDKLTTPPVNPSTEVDTQAGFARRMGMTRQAVSKAVAEGRIAGNAIAADGQIVVALAAQQLGRPLLGPAPEVDSDGGRKAAAEDPLYAESRARREAANAALAEMELQTRRGQLLERATAGPMIAGFFRSVRDGAIMAVREHPDRPEAALVDFFSRKASEMENLSLAAKNHA